MYIQAFLNPIERGCNYSKHFKNEWINNDKLHPAVKAIKVRVNDTFRTAQINVIDGEKVVISMKGNMINPAVLQEKLLELIEYKKK